MKLDRPLQRQILEFLAEIYPSGSHELYDDMDLGQTEDMRVRFLFNVQYLNEHGLLTSGYQVSAFLSDNSWEHMGVSTITARGLDFIADDGGLGAVLNTITVRLDATQWAELLASKVESLPNVNPAERSALAKALRSLPAKAIEKVSSKMLDWAVDHAADALPLLHKLIEQVSM